MERTKKLKDVLILIALSSFVLLWGLWSGSLSSWDEATYAQIAREMLNSHNYIDLTLVGKAWSDKPPLYMWMTVIAYKVFGVNEFSARLFSALCGIGTVIVTYLLAFKLYSRRIAIASALILLSTFHFIWAGKVAMLDSPLTFFISLSIYCFIKGEDHKAYYFFSALVLGFAFMTKGAGALLMPVIIFIYMLVSKKLKILREPMLWAGLITTFFIVVSWHLMAFLHYGKDFVEGYFKKHVFMRVSRAIEGHTGTMFTYFKVIANKGRPWGIAVFIIAPFALWEFIRDKGKSRHALPFIWVVITISLFSMVQTKLNWYIIPIYPAISMLTGWGIDKLFGKRALILTVLCFVASLVYLTIEKNIFYPNYSGDTKALACAFREKVNDSEKILVFSGDHAVQFYFLDNGVNIDGVLKPAALMKEKNRYVIVDKTRLAELEKSKILIFMQNKSFVIIKIKP